MHMNKNVKRLTTITIVFTLLFFAVIVPISTASGEQSSDIEKKIDISKQALNDPFFTESIDSYFRKTSIEQTSSKPMAPWFVIVDDDFDPSTPGWGINRFAVIQDGVDAVAEYGIVFVRIGVYYEPLALNKQGVRLIGEDKESTIIDRQHEPIMGIMITANKTKVRGFTVQNVISDICGQVVGIDIEGSQVSIFDTIIQNVHSAGNVAVGIRMLRTSHNIVKNNEIFNCDVGLFLWHGNSHGLIIDNELYENIYGIEMWDVSYNVLMTNQIFDNEESGIIGSVGIEEGPDHNIFYNNVISNNGGHGIELMYGDDNIIVNNDISQDETIEGYTGITIYHNAEHNRVINNQVTSYWIGIKTSSDNTYVINNDVQSGLYGIYANEVTNIDIIQNEVSSFEEAGLYLDGVSQAVVRGNQLMENPRQGIYVDDATDVVITRNSVDHQECGIEAKDSNHITITNNQVSFSDSHPGIIVKYSQNCLVRNNVVTDSGVGLTISHSTHNLAVSNDFSNNAYGIYSSYSSDNILHNNVIQENEMGIYFYNCSHNIIRKNEICNSDSNGFYLQDSVDNLIYHNNFIANYRNGNDDGLNNWDNGYPSGGNYWDDYNGEDLDGDGIGDTPYDIYGGSNQDRYPLMSPFF